MKSYVAKSLIGEKFLYGNNGQFVFAQTGVYKKFDSIEELKIAVSKCNNTPSDYLILEVHSKR